MTRATLPSIVLMIVAVLMFTAGLALLTKLWVGLITGAVLLFLVAAMALPDARSPHGR